MPKPIGAILDKSKHG